MGRTLAAAVLFAILAGPLLAQGWQVNLSCTAPDTSLDPVAGYIFLRALSGSNTYTQINATPAATCSYADSTVSAGASYVYTAESVDASGNASAPAAAASVTVPASGPPSTSTGPDALMVSI